MLAAVLSQAHTYPQLRAGHRTLRDAGERLRPGQCCKVVRLSMP